MYEPSVIDIVKQWLSDKQTTNNKDGRRYRTHYNFTPGFLRSVDPSKDALTVLIAPLRFAIAYRQNETLDNLKVRLCLKDRIRLMLVPPVDVEHIKERLNYQESLVLMYAQARQI